MTVEIELGTPLANALSAAMTPKLFEAGWASGPDDTALTEYIILMLINGKTQDEIAAEIGGELLGLAADDPNIRNFTEWMFEQIDTFSKQGHGAQGAGSGEANGGADMDTDMAANDVSELNAPTGPKSMRSSTQRGGREKRMLGHMSKAMDRTSDPLHQVRGGGARINTHARTPPTGPRTGQGRLPRNANRAANIQHGLAGMAAGNNQWAMQGQQPNQMELVAMLEQQNQMMFQLSQQLMNGQGGNFNQRGRGKSLFERTSRGGRQHHNNNNNHNHAQKLEGENGENAGGEDMDMGGIKEPLNPEDTVCKYNLKCTNKECKFAHQSPAAPVGAAIDVNDVCSFGAACKNRKCAARHPSPAQKSAHQSEQDCKFFPNCQNPRCPFKHPSMPLCRNGGNCTTPDCKFTHVKTKCKFNPCLNRNCAFQHDDGQQGGFKDKVWTADSAEHVSDRKFVDENGEEENVRPDEEVKEEIEQIS